jgi:hypothetical protein
MEGDWQVKRGDEIPSMQEAVKQDEADGTRSRLPNRFLLPKLRNPKSGYMEGMQSLDGCKVLF